MLMKGGAYLILWIHELQAFNYLLLLNSPVCVGPCRTPDDRFSQDAVYLMSFFKQHVFPVFSGTSRRNGLILFNTY